MGKDLVYRYLKKEFIQKYEGDRFCRGGGDGGMPPGIFLKQALNNARNQAIPQVIIIRPRD